MFEAVHKLEPGHLLTVEKGRVHKQQYWDLRFAGEGASGLSYAQAIEQLRELLSTAVADHMISDVPVGVLLSGGVDSTGVLSHAVRHSDRPLHTFTMGFEGHNVADERPYAALAARHFGTLHQEISMSADQFRDFLPRYVWHMEEPVCEPPAIALYFVSRLARESSVKVLLSGEGGDEAFGGYQEYRNLLFLEQLKSGFGPLKPLLKTGFQGLRAAGWQRGEHYAALVGTALSDYYFSRASSPQTPFNRRKDSLYNPLFRSRLAARCMDTPTRLLWERVSGQPLLNQMLYVDTKTWLPDDLLVKADKMTMATSVELRVPLLDTRILEFAASLPPRYKVRGTALKRMLKAALASDVPEEILNRKKTGFPVPYSRWLSAELADFVADTVLATNSFCCEYFRREEMATLLQQQKQGQDCAKEVFSLLVLELWHQQFVGRQSVADPARTQQQLPAPREAVN
jgi:asparagine synthase (glutamine-hydrolysing)